MELRVIVERIASRDRQLLKPAVQTTSVAMVRTLAANAGLLGLLVQENVFQDVAAGRLRWLPLSDAEAHSATGLYQRVGQRATVATGVFIPLLDQAFNEWVQITER
jgi:hypothetical protein